MIDLHCHSHFSDGILQPHELIEKAKLANLTMLALTDHDTIAGIDLLREAASTTNIQIISGIEISTKWKKHEIHIIGLNFTPNTSLMNLIAKQNESRIARGMAIGEALEKLGINDAYAQACTIAGHNRVGRPHFAEVLVQAGMVADRQTAFKRYLGRGRDAYVPSPWVSLEEAVAVIIEAKGIATIAHPLKYGLTALKLRALITTFKEAGGLGIEVVSGEMTVTQAREMAGLALRYELLASSGSDYHGDKLSRIGLGRQLALPTNVSPIWLEWTKGIL